VHEQLLVHHSGFFRAALTGNFKEAQEKVITLENDDSITFEFFVHWLYFGRFPDQSFGDDEDLLELWEASHTTVEKSDYFVHLYIFGDKYMIEELKFDALNGLFHWLKAHDESKLPSTTATDEAFNDLPSDSPMCHFLIEASCKWANPMITACDNVEILHGIWRRLYELETAAGMLLHDHDIDICDFHDHKTHRERNGCKEYERCGACK